jgi:hypothetical protein
VIVKHGCLNVADVKIAGGLRRETGHNLASLGTLKYILVLGVDWVIVVRLYHFVYLLEIVRKVLLLFNNDYMPVFYLLIFNFRPL